VVAVVVATALSATRHQLDRRILSGFLVIVAAIIVGQWLSTDEYGAAAHLASEIAFLVVQNRLGGGFALGCPATSRTRTAQHPG